MLTGLGVGAAEAASRYNTAGIYVQEQSNWCWVATSKTVLNHYNGSSPSQCQVYKWGKNSSSCPDGAGDFGIDVSGALTRGGVGGIGQVVTHSIPFATVQDEINVNRLVMVRWSWNSSPSATGHMVILRGYNTTGSTVSYVNPLNSSYQSSSYSAMVGDGTHTWTHTRYLITA